MILFWSPVLLDLSNGGLELHAFGLVATLSAYIADRSFVITKPRYSFGSYFISLLDGERWTAISSMYWRIVLFDKQDIVLNKLL